MKKSRKQRTYSKPKVKKITLTLNFYGRRSSFSNAFNPDEVLLAHWTGGSWGT